MRDRIIAAAQSVRANAYAPYSVYQVGSAVLGRDGTVAVGCNVENASFGLTVCAERAAIAALVAAGCRSIVAIAVATEDGALPCGMCRQTIAEFCNDPADVTVYTVDAKGNVATRTLAELWPHGFKLPEPQNKESNT